MYKLNSVKVLFEDCKHNYTTSVSPSTNHESAKDYFVGKSFNVGVFPIENFQKCIGIEYTDNNPQCIIIGNRVFVAKAAWSMSAPLVICNIEEVVKTVLGSEYFKNGIEYIKELEGLKLVRISKENIKKLLSNSKEQEQLFNQLNKIY